MAASNLSATTIGLLRPRRLSVRSPPATQLNHRPNYHFNCTLKSNMTTGKSKGDVKVFDSNENLSLSLANYISDLSEKVTAQKSTFTVVFSGGSLFKSLRFRSLIFLLSFIHALIYYYYFLNCRVELNVLMFQ